MKHLQLKRAFLINLIALLGGCTEEPPAECAAGTVGCPCIAAERCDEGLVCDQDDLICREQRTVSLPPIDASARSCEILLEDDGAEVVGARFDGPVRGEHIRQAPRTALAFFATTDSSIASTAVSLEVLGSGDPRIAHAQCFDRDGNPIPGGGMTR